MAKLKRFIEKAKQMLAHTRAEEKTLRERIQRIKGSSRCLPATLKEIESMRRDWRAKKLTRGIEDQLKTAIDPKKRTELMACAAFVEYLIANGNYVPKTHKELLQVYDEFSSKAQRECLAHLSCVSNSEQMLLYAARNEKPSQKN